MVGTNRDTVSLEFQREEPWARDDTERWSRSKWGRAPIRRVGIIAVRLAALLFIGGCLDMPNSMNEQQVRRFLDQNAGNGVDVNGIVETLLQDGFLCKTLSRNKWTDPPDVAAIHMCSRSRNAGLLRERELRVNLRTDAAGKLISFEFLAFNHTL